MNKKVFKTIEEQIDIFRRKGLIISDEDSAKDILYRENFFFINGYRYILLKSLKDKTFIEGSKFEELYAIFQFDRAFRNIIFKNLLIVENNLKSILSYELSRKYGVTEKEYLNPNNFTSDSIRIRQVSDVLNKVKRQIRVNGKQHSATLHYISNYGFIPMWVLVKVLSFGMINELYDILKSNDQIELAEIYNLDSETFGLYISLLSNYRNLCAHEDILYDHKTQREIADTRYHRELNIETLNDEYIYGKNDLFAVVIMMRYMLKDRDFREMVNEISYELDTLDGKIDIIPQSKILDKMGFPDNWKEIQNIN